MTQNIYGQFLFIAKTYWWLWRKIRSCRTVWPNRKDMPPDFGLKQLELERGDVRMKTRGGLSALVWKERREVYMLTNMHPPPAEGNFCDDSSHPVKPYIIERYNRHIGYVDNSDRMANSFSISWCNFKRTKKLFFHLLDLTVLKSWILLSSCGAQYTHRDFRLSGEECDWRSQKKPRSPHPQFGWKTKCGGSKYCAAREPS